MSIKVVATLDRVDEVKVLDDGSLMINEGLYNSIYVKLEAKHIEGMIEGFRNTGFMEGK
ncbi:MAG: hypothetical protein RR782_02825 [Clostridium sp.]